MLITTNGLVIRSYPSGNSEHVKPLVEDDRINYVCVADYSPHSALENIVKLMIENMAIIDRLEAKEEKQLAQYMKSARRDEKDD